MYIKDIIKARSIVFESGRVHVVGQTRPKNLAQAKAEGKKSQNHEKIREGGG